MVLPYSRIAEFESIKRFAKKRAEQHFSRNLRHLYKTFIGFVTIVLNDPLFINQ